MAKLPLKLVAPSTVNRTVLPRRRKNGELRTREFLTETEVERLIKAAKANRYGQRDAIMIFLAYRHGLRAAELVDLRWGQVEFESGTLHGALRRLKREQSKSPFVFTSERGAPFTTAGFAKMVARAGEAAKFAFKAHPHMLRHACGYALANKASRHASAASLSEAQEHPAYGKIYSTQRFRDFWRE